MKKQMLFLFLALVILNIPVLVSSTHITDGLTLLAYMEGNSTPPYRTWNSSNASNSSELYAQDIGSSDPDWVEITPSPVNFTAVMVITDTLADVNAQVWNGSTWSNNQEMTAASREGDHGADVAFENNSGRALVIYNNRQTTPKYRIWNGTGWSSENSAQDVGSEPEDLRAKGNLKRNEIILITREADSSIDVQVWNSTTWNNQTSLSTTSLPDDTPIAVAYESLSKDAIVVWGNINDDTPNYVVWNGSAFSSAANALSIGGGTQEPIYIELASHPYSDNITMMTIDDQSDVNVQVWNGSAWTSQQEITTSACNTAFCADIIFEGRNNKSIVVYADATNIPKYRTWNSTTWSAEQSVADIGAVPVEIDLSSHPNKNETTLLIQDDSQSVTFFTWNATNWTARGTIGTGLNQNNRKAISQAYIIPPGDPPSIDSITESSDPIKGGSTITITANTVSDQNNGTLALFCDVSTTPNSTNTDCTGGTTSDETSPYSLTCTFTVSSDDTTYTEYCRVYDQIEYSDLVNLSYLTDSTVPTTTILNVSGDTTATYVDSTNDGFTNITVTGEANMVCRFGTSDAVYESMSSANECTIISSRAICPAIPSQGTPDFYVSCRDSVQNEQNTTQNLDVTDLLVDWTAPTTQDNSVSDIKTPTYLVTITEIDNVDSDPDTQFCRDTLNVCTPSTAIDSGGQISFNISHRGTNYIRYNSSDDAGNKQSIQSKTININQLPVLTSASANLSGTILGGSTINISTSSSEPNYALGQALTMYVCNATGASASSGCTSGTTLCSNITNSSNNTYCIYNTQTNSQTHSWFVYLFDDSEEGASNNPQSGTYTTDSTSPNITILDPQNTTYTQTSVTAQVALSESAHTTLYSLDAAANVSMTNVSSTLFTATLSSLSNSLHNIVFYVNDTVGNLNLSSTRYFTVDTTATDTTGPAIVVLSPTNSSFHNSAVLLNLSLSEDGATSTYSLDGAANQSLGNISKTLWNITITPSQASHSIIFYANDTSSNKNTGASVTTFFTYDTTPPAFTQANTTPTTVTDSVNVTCYAIWTDNVNLSIGVVEENSTGSFVNHTFVLSQTSNTTNYTIDEINLTPGTVGCSFFANDTTANLNSTQIAFAVSDLTNPQLSNITSTPQSQAGLDPNVRINITANVTDNFNLTVIILQFRQHNESTYTNFTMTNQTPQIYSGNFTPDRDNNWTYRIFTADAQFNKNISSETNISVQTDKTWLFTDTIEETTSIVQTDNRVISLGNITINNTGDVPINFNLSSNVSWVTLNGTTDNSLILNLSSGSAVNITNITANTAGFAVGLFPFTLSATTNLSDSSPTSNSTALQVNIQNTAGPFLSVTIDTFTSTVSKGQTGVTYGATVKNLGTADASSVWLAWALPSEFTLATGTQNKSIGNLIIGGTSTNTITIDVSSSSDDKNTTINATARASSGTNDTKSKTVTIGSPTTTTTDSSAASAGGGGGGGGGAGAGGGGGGLIDKILGGEEILTTKEIFELVRGESDSFPVDVKNIFEKTTMQNITSKVEGFLSQYMQITPQVINQIPYNQSDSFNVKITSPEYLEKGEHELTVIITGKLIGKKIDKDLKETREVKLIIHTISKQGASQKIELSEQDIGDMTKAGFPTTKISKLLEEALQAVQDHRYDDAKDLAEKISQTKLTAVEANQLMQQIKNKIKDQSPITGGVIGVSKKRFKETQNLLNLAQAAFEREDYETALKRAQEAFLTLALENKEFDLAYFLIKYWWAIILSLMLLSVGAYFGYLYYMRATLTQKIKDLQKEEETIQKLRREIQKKYYQDKSIGTDTFYKTMSQYQARLSKIRQIRTTLRHKRARLLKSSQLIKDLEEEKKEITKQLQTLQKDYFIHAKISKAAYQVQSKDCNERLAEIDDEQLTLKTKLQKGGKK